MPDIGNTIQNTVIDTTMGVAVGETAGNIATDILLDELIDALVEQYAKASLQMQEKCDKYFGKYAEEDKKKRALLDAGKISKDDYRAWQNGKALGSKQWMDMRDTLAQDLTNCNEIAADIINDRKCDIYALNHNYGMYEIENNVGAYTSYTLYDHDTVERLIAQNPEILPKAKINIPKDLRWNKHLLTSAVTQGILQGESIPAIAKRMAAVTDMDRDAAIRNARTATTGAQNAGRVDSYKHAEKLGIKVTQIWISTLDGRTRTSHRHLMGQKRPLGKPFSNGLLFPGDPNGPGWEVYNCRCTLIAEPDGSGYDLEKTIDKNLSKKGMTFDEWLNEQPLSKHYEESKQHYLERYAKHKQQLPFSDWLEETAAPDSVIQSVWGNKKMSQMYNEIKAQSVTDANKFYKELGKLGKPSEIWDKYLTGQLDAEDMKNFEDILKKYLPSSAPVKVADNISDAVKVADDVTKGKAIHPKAQDSLDQLEFKAGTPMSKDAADTYKVNPLYDKADKATTKNCQTSAFAYECRRQGYDVVALPKYGLNIDDPELKEILQLQNTLGKNARLGWINKETGAPATLVIEHSNPMMVMSNSEMIDELENAIGKSGERYIMGVRWKGTTSCHAINIDRTPDGKLRIIDNQRGPLEKNTWVGKEIEDYLNTVQRIRHVTRVDDCVPNAEYFNKIVVDAKKIKADLPSNVSAFKDYSKLAKQAKDAGEKMSTYYVKWKAGLIDNKDLDDLLMHKVTPKTDLDKYKANLLKDPKLEDIFDNIAIEAAKDNQFFMNDYLTAYLKGEKQSDYLDDMLKKKLPSSVSAKVDDIAEIKKTLPTVLFELPYEDVNLYNKVQSIISSAVPPNMTKAAYWQKYLKGEIINTDLDDVVKQFTKSDLPDILKKTDLIDPMTGEVLNKIEEFEKIKKMPITDLDDMANKLTKDYYGLKIDDAKEILKGSGLNIPEKTTAANATNNVAEIVKNEIGDVSHWMGVYFKVSDISFDLANELKDIADDIYLHHKDFINKTEVLNAYFDGTLKSTELDDIFTKIYKDKIPTASATTKTTTAVDIDAVKNKKVTAIYNEIKADLGTSEANAFYNKTLKEIGSKNSWSQGEVWKKYLAGDLDADDVKKIDDHLIKKYSKTVEPPKPIFDKSAFDTKKMSQVYNDIKATDTATANKFYNDLKKMGKPSEVWDEYLKGNLPQDKVDIIETHLKKKYTTAPSAQSAKTTQTTTKSDKLIKAEEKLKATQDELKAAEKALKDNVDTFETWDGIWKEEVTLADYAKKKSTIDAKKLYYEEEIDKLEHDPNYKSWLSAEDKQDKIWNLQHLYSDLEDFEKAGKKAEKYFNDLEKAQNKVTAAQKEVDSLQPAGEAYTQARKDNAKWFTSKSYHTGDKYYSNLSATKNAHKSATSGEHNAYYEYTSASGGFNRPLAGFKAPKYSGGSGWDEKYYKGVGKVPLDNEGKGKDIKNLTSLIEKSKMEDDIWIQTAQNYATLEGKNGFLGIPYGTLSGMTDKELQQFVGVENQLGQFISGSINRGGGSYTPGNMRINIYCPKGSEALYVLSDGAFGKAEHEIILQRGGTYKVSKIYWGKDVEHGGKKLIVDLELRLEKGYNKYEK